MLRAITLVMVELDIMNLPQSTSSSSSGNWQGRRYDELSRQREVVEVSSEVVQTERGGGGE